jgi:hypothetical protein
MAYFETFDDVLDGFVNNPSRLKVDVNTDGVAIVMDNLKGKINIHLSIV